MKRALNVASANVGGRAIAFGSTTRPSGEWARGYAGLRPSYPLPKAIRHRAFRVVSAHLNPSSPALTGCPNFRQTDFLRETGCFSRDVKTPRLPKEKVFKEKAGFYNGGNHGTFI